MLESFPRMWDKHMFLLLDWHALRHIPTCVEQTLTIINQIVPFATHSHVRGINNEIDFFKYTGLDSKQLAQEIRIIPTHVG